MNGKGLQRLFPIGGRGMSCISSAIAVSVASCMTHSTAGLIPPSVLVACNSILKRMSSALALLYARRAQC
eukprot:364640-Chlamydomonas_euryale.AAC.18